MVASAGVEIGSFNLAYLCELDPDSSVSENFLTSADSCMYRYFNQSIFVDENSANSYALIKMAEYHQEKLQKSDEIKSIHLKKSVELNTLAYKRGEAQVN